MIGGVRIIEMLFRSNLFAIVFHPGEKVYIWDDHQEVFIGELTFHTQVLGVRLRRDKIVVVLAQKIFIYNFEDLKLLKQLESTGNCYFSLFATALPPLSSLFSAPCLRVVEGESTFANLLLSPSSSFSSLLFVLTCRQSLGIGVPVLL